ncbi:hypothetical protein B296_00034190, partial [Ensete ventricosum]
MLRRLKLQRVLDWENTSVNIQHEEPHSIGVSSKLDIALRKESKNKALPASSVEAVWGYLSTTKMVCNSNNDISALDYPRITGFTDPDSIRVTRIRKFLYGSVKVCIRFSINPHAYGNSRLHGVFSATIATLAGGMYAESAYPCRLLAYRKKVGWKNVKNGKHRTARYISVRQLIGTRTSRYRAVPLKWAVGNRLREKSTVGSRLKKKKGRRRGKEERKIRGEEVPRAVLAWAPSSPAGDVSPRWERDRGD